MDQYICPFIIVYIYFSRLYDYHINPHSMNMKYEKSGVRFISATLDVRFTDEKFKQRRHSEIELGSPDIEERLSNLERQFQRITSILANRESIISCPPTPQDIDGKPHESTLLYRSGSNLVSQNTSRARGLVGYDVALTRRRSPVRIRPSPFPDSNLVIHSRVSASFTNLTFGFSFPRQWTFGLSALCFPKAILL